MENTKEALSGGIAIYNNDNFDEENKIDLPTNLICTSTSQSVALQGAKLNNGIGETLPLKNKSYLSIRIFTIQGNIEVSNIRDVENTRSHIIAQLYGKPLYFFRDVEDDRYYLCHLQGNINVTYNQGYNIGRVFTISFNLVCFDGYSFKKELQEETQESIKEITRVIDYQGSISVFPNIKIERVASSTATAKSFSFNFTDETFSLIKIGKYEIVLTQEITNKEINYLRYKDGLLFVCYNSHPNNEVLCEYVTTKSLASPPLIKNGKNTIIININTKDNQLMKVAFSYREKYY